MRNVRVKICGITKKEDLAAAVDAGADAVGFLVGVPSSPRNLTIERVKVLLSKVPIFIQSVVVTAAQNIEDLVEIHQILKPSAIQIHGEKQFVASEIRHILKDTRLIKTIYVKSGQLEKESLEDLKNYNAILLDSFTKNQFGGTGRIHDWEVSKQIKKAVLPIPVILAGGLKPENVKEAILTVKPYAVDVASGVELNPGIKDHEKVHVFVETAKKIKLAR